MDLKLYKNREYCKNIKCKILERNKSLCKLCNAYKFHKWLKKNNYQIIKGDDAKCLKDG